MDRPLVGHVVRYHPYGDDRHLAAVVACVLAGHGSRVNLATFRHDGTTAPAVDVPRASPFLDDGLPFWTPPAPTVRGVPFQV